MNPRSKESAEVCPRIELAKPANNPANITIPIKETRVLRIGYILIRKNDGGGGPGGIADTRVL